MEFGNENVRVSMEEDDRISSLPDEIIHLILSFNGTKYAVQTSVLSSRWKLIWTTLPYLCFYVHQFRTLTKYYKFVNQVLSLRNIHSEVSSLEFSCRKTPDQTFMQEIANYAVCHNVQKVRLFGFRKGKEDHRYPLCYFSSQSIKDLTVFANPYTYFPLPQSPWDTPALTTVVLHHVWLCADNTTCLDLFSKCVNLKNLRLNCCHSRGLKLMKITCPRLVHLTISYDDASNLEILAPNLLSFYYIGNHTSFLSTGDGLNSLEKVNLCMYIFCSARFKAEKQSQAHDLMNMLNEVRSARFVTLNGYVIEFLFDFLDLLEHQPSPFCNLKCLSIEGLDGRKNRAKSDLTNQVINFLLNSSPTAAVSKEYREETQ